MLADLLPLLPLLPLGLLAGILSGLLGIGGGLLFSPMLLLVGLPPHQALATSTVAIVPTTLGGVWSHWRQGTLPLGPSFCIGASALVSGLLFSRVGEWLSGGQLLAIQAGMYLLLTCTIAPNRELPSEPGVARPWPLAGLGAVGGVAGFAGGLLGVGGGLLMVPLMVRGLSLPIRGAIRLSTFAVLCSASTASVEFLGSGRARGLMALLLGATAAVAARWSAARLERVSEALLVRLLRLVTGLLAFDSGRRALALLLAG